MQAVFWLACDLASALCGLIYLMYITFRLRRQTEDSVKVTVAALKTLARPSVYTFTESAIRNAIYLWLVNRIILLGENYATAWGVFNTIRWGLIMVPVQTLEASTLTFVGHNWGRWRACMGVEIRQPKASRAEIVGMTVSYSYLTILANRRDSPEIIRPAVISCSIALAVEVIICIALSTHGMQTFAYFLSGSEIVAQITQMMWKVVTTALLSYYEIH
jgi:Na+-driven multidrug efflux pump